MQNPGRAYFFGASGVFASSVISAVAGIVSLWLLARILNTEQFAGYVVAMSIVVVVGFNAGLALERVLVLRLAELPQNTGVLAGRRMLLSVLAAMLALAALATGGIFLFAQYSGQNGTWLIAMSPLVVITTISIALSAWFQANHRVGTSAVMLGVTDGSRCLFFAIIYVLGFGGTAVASSAVASSAVLAGLIPIAVLIALAWGKSTAEPNLFRLRDVGVGLQFLLIRLSQMGLRQFDIIIVGLLSTAAETAFYAVASRISRLTSVGYMAFGKTYVPRVRNHLANENWPAIEREFHAARLFSLLATLAGAFGLFLLGEPILQLLGDFSAGYSALVILMTAQVLTSCFNLHTEHLSMCGNLRLAVAIRVGTTVVFVASLLVLVPFYSTLGAAISSAIAAAVFSVSGALAVRHKSTLNARRPSLVLSTLVCSTAFIVGVLVPTLWTIALGVLACTIIALLLAERKLLTHIVTTLLRR